MALLDVGDTIKPRFTSSTAVRYTPSIPVIWPLDAIAFPPTIIVNRPIIYSTGAGRWRGTSAPSTPTGLMDLRLTSPTCENTCSGYPHPKRAKLRASTSPQGGGNNYECRGNFLEKNCRFFAESARAIRASIRKSAFFVRAAPARKNIAREARFRRTQFTRRTGRVFLRNGDAGGAGRRVQSGIGVILVSFGWPKGGRGPAAAGPLRKSGCNFGR